MNKKIRDAYESINMSKDIENKIISNCIDSGKIIRRKRLALILSLICLFLFLGTRVSAEDFEKLWTKIINMGAVEDIDGERYQMYEEVNGCKLNDLSDILAGKEYDSTVDEVEQLLGIKLLKYDDTTSNDMKYRVLKNFQNGKIGRVYLRQLNFYTPDMYGWNDKIGIENGFNLSINILADDAEEEVILSYLEEMNVQAGKKVLEEYYSENLGTKILVYEYEYDKNENGYFSLNAMFVYKNIRYIVGGYFDNNLPLDKLKEIIEQLHE